MNNQSYYVHLRNKFPGAHIDASGNSLIVTHPTTGEVLCAVTKDGHGHWNDAQDDYGAKFKFSLDPLPKNARFTKLHPSKMREVRTSDGNTAKERAPERTGPAEEAAERRPIAERLRDQFGYVPGVGEIKSAKRRRDAGEPTSDVENELAALELNDKLEVSFPKAPEKAS